MLEKIIISIVSSVLFSLILGLITFFSMDSGDQTSLLSSFFVYLIFSLPVFIIGGALFSYFVEAYLDGKNINYIIKLILYGVGGIILGGAYLILIANNLNDAKWSSIIIVSFGAAMIYYHLLLINIKYNTISKFFSLLSK
ncbi:hypothetical protein [Virgibacillus sp. MG-45]|uniref:hypothetical protein n=1 Tax=Virgibacillus sp. MG-45 TaxID=3102791 RepID=UPI002ED8A821